MTLPYCLPLIVMMVGDGDIPSAGQKPGWTARQTGGRLEIAAGRPVADYVFRDEKILRPYLASVRTPSGVQVTRHHPPREGIDLADHETMHPGIWFALSSLTAGDFWRNKDRVEFVRWTQPPAANDQGIVFEATFRYMKGERVLARDTSRIEWSHHGERAYRLRWKVILIGAEDLVFGDVEEQGLGVRVATSMAEKNGGTLRNSQGEMGEAELWGKSADWCLYEGVVGTSRAGVLLRPSPMPDRPFRFHARDYGMMTANPFGEKSFTGSGDGSLRIPAGKPIEFQFDLFFYDGSDGEKLLAMESLDPPNE